MTFSIVSGDECVTELNASQRGSVTISVRETTVETGTVIQYTIYLVA